MSKKLMFSMMAGIFSVGMLAACGDGETDGTDPMEPADPAQDEMQDDEMNDGMGDDSDM